MEPPTADVEDTATTGPATGARPAGLDLAVAVYAWAAFGAVVVTLLLAAFGQLSVSPLRELVHVYGQPSAVFYQLAAAFAALLLARRSRHAVWPAASVATWAMLPVAWRVAHPAAPFEVFEGVRLFWCLVFVVLVVRVVSWRRAGRLA